VKYIAFVASPPRVLFSLAVLVALALFLVRRTSWRVVGATPLRRRRRAGEIWRLAVTEYRRHPGVFAAVGAIAVPIAGLAALIGLVLTHLPFVGRFLEVADTDAASTRLVTSSIVGGALVALPFVVVSALVASAVDDDAGARLSLPRAWRVVRARARALLVAFVVAVVVIVLVSLTVIGVPVATWLFVRWQFMPQAAVLEGLGRRASLRRSGALTRRRWWHTALVTGVTLAVVNGFGIVVGLVLLVLFTGLPLWVLSVVVAVCNVLAMPFGALVMTYLYGDAVSASRERSERHALAESVSA
jgi:hypothetical protein